MGGGNGQKSAIARAKAQAKAKAAAGAGAFSLFFVRLRNEVLNAGRRFFFSFLFATSSVDVFFL